jgi:hypothetical protein
MGLARTSDDRPERGVGYCSSLISNASFVILAISAALLTAEFARPNLYSYEITDENLAGTREAIDDAAANLPPQKTGRRAFWGQQVKAALDQSDLDKAKGYLLLAPQMLSPEESRHLNAGLNDPRIQSPKAHSADDRMIQAAVLLLPPDARTAWTEATAEPDPVGDFFAKPIENVVNWATNIFKPAQQRAQAAPPPDPFALDEADALADDARRLLTGESIDMTRFKLTGFAQFLPGTDNIESGDGGAIRNAASTILGARAEKHLSPLLQDALAQRLNAALPDDALRRELQNAYAAPNARNDPLAFGRTVKDAFAKATQKKGAEDTAALLKQINAVANSTSQKGAADLLRFVAADGDMARLQLTAQAGGLRVLALSDRLNEEVLSLAKGTVKARARIGIGIAVVILSSIGIISVFLFTLFQALGRLLEKRARENLPFGDSFWPQTSPPPS